MAIPWTLQRYIFRETAKTLLLTVLALTAVLSLGGGVMQMIRLGEATPGQLLRLMILVIPLSAALTLPIAALFSAAVTYGRFSADHEFMACSSSGINLHVLFLPSIVLSLLSSVVTFGFTNFLIPHITADLQTFLMDDIGALVRQQLNRPQGIKLGEGVRASAEESSNNPADPNQVILRGISYVEGEAGEWVRFGTAREVRLNVQRQESGALSVSGSMNGITFYDRKADQFFQAEEQVIGAQDLSGFIPREIKFLNLGRLLHFLANPGEWDWVRQRLEKLRNAIAQHLLLEELWKDWSADQTLYFEDRTTQISLRSSSGARRPRDGGLEFENVRIEERKGERKINVTTDSALVECVRSDNVENLALKIELFGARLDDGRTRIHRARDTRGPLAVSPAIAAQVRQLSDKQLFQTIASETEDDPVTRSLLAARNEWFGTIRRIVATIHERTAFSVSAFVLVILGAALGIIFRGSHVLAAFGISFVPSLLVLICIVMGKQMSHNASTHGLGLLVMWSGIMIVALLDAWVLTRVLRR